MSHFQRISTYSLLFTLLTTIMSFTLNIGNNDNGAPAKNAVSQTVSLVIKGTSTLHDWEMKSDKGRVEVLLGLGSDARLMGLSALKFSLEAESLKSEKTMMDNNAYKALKTNSAKQISFVLTNASITQLSATSYRVKAIGKLTVAGTTRETDVIAEIAYSNTEKMYIVTGTKKLKMTDYNVKPPSFMLGTVKTGDEITISFKTKLAS